MFGLVVVDALRRSVEHEAATSAWQAMMRDEWTGASASIGDHGTAGEPVDALPPGQLQAVVPTISAPVLHDPPPTLENPVALETVEARAAEVDVPWAGFAVPPFRRADLEIAGALAVTVSLLGSDVRLGLMCGVVVYTSAVLRRVDRRIPFSFGQGFLGYRSDLGWPQGVQEDDDFRWNWKTRVPAKREDG